jgi:hypothetical protein
VRRLVVDVGAVDLACGALQPTPITNNAVKHATRLTPLGHRYGIQRSTRYLTIGARRHDRTLGKLYAMDGVEGCLACDLAAGRQGGRIHETAYWIVEHCVGPLGVGTLLVATRSNSSLSAHVEFSRANDCRSADQRAWSSRRSFNTVSACAFTSLTS